MRKIAITVAATVSIVVLLFSYHTSTNQDPVAVAGDQPFAPPPAISGAPSTSGALGGGASGTFTGTAVDTRYGPVQVQITVSGGRITAARTLQVPQQSSRDIRINSAAVPILNNETVQAQSAQIDTVSGATYTSEGYAQSLQSAIDAVHQ
jgi:uncharacterized protein with FMN-binding domain